MNYLFTSKRNSKSGNWKKLVKLKNYNICVAYKYMIHVSVQRDVQSVGGEFGERMIGAVQEREVFAHACREVLQSLLTTTSYKPEPTENITNCIKFSAIILMF